MNEIRYLISTTMEKEDYRKFLYLATFFRNKIVIPMIAGIAFLGSLFINWKMQYFNWGAIVVSWLFLFALAIATVCFKVERKNKQRVNSDKTGTFGSVNVLKFYDDRVTMENDSLKSTGELKYTQFFLCNGKQRLFYFLSNR